MSDGIVKSSGKKASDFAKNVTKQAGAEPSEFIKSVKSQLASDKDVQRNVDSEGFAEWVKDGEISQSEKDRLRNEAKKRIEELKEEIRKLREKRKQTESNWSQEQEVEMGRSAKEETEKLVEPTPKPKSGFLRGGLGVRKKKQGTREPGKQVAG